MNLTACRAPAVFQIAAFQVVRTHRNVTNTQQPRVILSFSTSFQCFQKLHRVSRTILDESMGAIDRTWRDEAAYIIPIIDMMWTTQQSQNHLRSLTDRSDLSVMRSSMRL